MPEQSIEDWLKEQVEALKGECVPGHCWFNTCPKHEAERFLATRAPILATILEAALRALRKTEAVITEELEPMDSAAPSPGVNAVRESLADARAVLAQAEKLRDQEASRG